MKFVDGKDWDESEPFPQSRGRTRVYATGATIWLDKSLEMQYLEAIAAHELCHFLLMHEGFPIAIWNDSISRQRVGKSRAAAFFVVSALTDPIIDHRLAKRGFPVLELVSKELQEAVRHLEEGPTFSEQENEFHMRALSYMKVKLTLLNEQVDRFVALVQQKAPSTYRWGEELTRMALESGYETVDGNWNAAVQVFERLQLCHVGLEAPGRRHAPRW